MNVGAILLWGFLATMVQSITMAGARGVGITRMSMPFMLGTIVTPSRDRAPFVGFGLHVLTGWAFSFVYAAAFDTLGRATWWIGGAFGVVHGLVVLTVLLPLLPGLHPRMARPGQGPEATRALEPPGFLGLNYGVRTPVVTMLAHIAYGVILGLLYRPL